MSGREVSEEEIQRIERERDRRYDVWLSPSTYDMFHDAYTELAGALQEARPYVRALARRGSEQAQTLLERIDLALQMKKKAPLGDESKGYRIWVSEDGMTLARMWDNGTVEVAHRGNSWETWGPPITLTEEKT